MSDRGTRLRVWTLRVAQEFEVEAATADEALAFAHKLRARKTKGAKLIEGKAVVGEKSDG